MTHALLFSICPPFCSALIRVNPLPISSPATIAKSLVGNYREEHLFALGQAVSLYETYQAKIAECEAAIGRYLGSQPNRTDQEPPPEDKSVRNRDRLRGGVDVRSQLYKMTGADLFSLPGLAADTLLTLAGEVGFDMTPWRSEKDFTSWLALCPGTRKSNGKVLSRKTKHSANRAAAAFRIAAASLSRSKTALGARRYILMLETTKNILATLFLLLIVIPVSFAQEPTPSPQNNPNRNLTERDSKSKIFEVKYRDAGRLAGVLQGLGSRAASVSANSEFKTITVRDYPENLVIMEEALKRLGTPVAPRPNIELHMHVLIASNTSGNKSDSTAQVPAELKDVLTQLRETLSYRNYELATSVVQRLTTEMSRGVEGRGTLEISREDLNAPNIQMPYHITFVSLMQNATGGPTVQINEFRFGAVTDKDHAGVQTALNLRDGEKVVVGTATIRNRALIVVLSARLIN